MNPTPAGWFFITLVIVVPILVILEARRERKKHGRGTGTGPVGAGLMELQRHLEPEKKIEMFLEKRDELEHDDTGEGTKPGGGK